MPTKLMHECTTARSNLSGQRGFTLVELMVAMVIGMVLVLAIATILNRHEGGRRTLTSNNDASMAANFTSFTLDQQFRDAGTDFLYTRNGVQDPLGCALNVQRAGGLVLPAPAAFPAPFNTVPRDQRLAPFIIYPGLGLGGSDVLSVMSGASGLGGVMMTVQAGTATGSSIRVTTNSLGTKGGDLALINDPALGGCVIQQLAPGYVGGTSDVLSFGGDYADAVVGAMPLPAVGDTGGATVAMIGNATTSSPKFYLYGVGARNELVTYDLLRLDGTTATQVLAEGVLDLRAVYGINSDNDPLNTIDTWVEPTGAYAPAALLAAPTAASQTALRSIVAVRVGVIVRSDILERDAVSPTDITMFNAVGLPVNKSLTSTERRYRVRSVEFTVPLRNQAIN